MESWRSSGLCTRRQNLRTNDTSNHEEKPAEDQSADLRESFQIVITCADEAQQSTLLERFAEEGLKCRALI